MRKTSLVALLLITTFFSRAQDYIRGSIRKGTPPNSVDILFKANFTSNVGEYVNYVQFSLAIPAANYVPGLVANLTPVGNFSTLTFAQGPQYTQASTSERVFTWVCVNPAITTMAWVNDVEFVGATVTFSGGTPNSQVKMTDYTNIGGGSNSNTYFAIVSTRGDVTDYFDFFYTNPGQSSEGIYGNGDQFVQTIPIIALPVDLLSFSGYRSGSRNILNWTTSSESNNRGFEVQRSIDGVTYSSIGFVNTLAPNGNSTTELRYTFNDNNLVGNKQYYRLRQEDFDGRSKLSSIVLIQGERGPTFTISGLFPNPASDIVNVLIDAPGREQVTLLVTDMSGHNVAQKIAAVETGSNTIPVNVSTLANGTYIVRMVCANGCNTEIGKFVKQ